MNILENPSEGRNAEGGGASGNERKVVLLVEDTEADRDVYGGLLWYNGYHVIHAATAEEALSLARENRPDLVLLDVILPGELTGLDVAERLREEGLSMPIIGLSAVPREDVATAIAESGIALYLEKPMDPFLVVREVMRFVGAAQSGSR